uniref:HTH CENPB-type domain-containing protein n=1 Tax=Ditylenchus dipsaci TaxID=166011 RepID=A0A915E6V4_9BILA
MNSRAFTCCSVSTSSKFNLSLNEARFKMPLTTVCRILKEKESVIEAFESGSQAKRIRLKTGKHEQIEEAVVTWLKQIRSQNIPISGDLLKVSDFIVSYQRFIVES